MTVDYDALANQARSVDYDALANEARSGKAPPPNEGLLQKAGEKAANLLGLPLIGKAVTAAGDVGNAVMGLAGGTADTAPLVDAAKQIGSRVAQTPRFLAPLMGPANIPDYGKMAEQYAANPEDFKRKMTDAALDVGTGMVWGPASAALTGVGVTNVIARNAIENAGIGAIYEGVDAAVTGHTMREVVDAAWRGAKGGGAVGASIGAIGASVHGTLSALAGKMQGEAEVAQRGAVQEMSVQDRGSTLRAALDESGLKFDEPTPPTPPPIEPAGLLGPGPEPGTPPVNVLPHGTETRYDVPRIWGSDRMLPERSSIPPVNELPSSGATIPLEAQGVSRLKGLFPKIDWDIQPVGIRSSQSAKTFPIGSEVYDVAGRKLSVVAYASDGRIGVQSLHPGEIDRFGAAFPIDVSLGPPSPFVILTNHLELGARTRLALRETTNAKDVAVAADEVAIGVGKLGRVEAAGDMFGWTPAERFQEWARSMVPELGDKIRPRLQKLFQRAQVKYEEMKKSSMGQEALSAGHQ